MKGVENPSRRPQLRVNLEGDFPLYEGRSIVQIFQVIVDPVLMSPWWLVGVGVEEMLTSSQPSKEWRYLAERRSAPRLAC
jgi:hypothetical protein